MFIKSPHYLPYNKKLLIIEEKKQKGKGVVLSDFLRGKGELEF